LIVDHVRQEESQAKRVANHSNPKECDC